MPADSYKLLPFLIYMHRAGHNGWHVSSRSIPEYIDSSWFADLRQPMSFAPIPNDWSLHFQRYIPIHIGRNAIIQKMSHQPPRIHGTLPIVLAISTFLLGLVKLQPGITFVDSGDSSLTRPLETDTFYIFTLAGSVNTVSTSDSFARSIVPNIISTPWTCMAGPR